jgi:serine kinase of HPr protein (carbohydrate metabolism regulator)
MTLVVGLFMLLHASSVAIEDKAVLITGAPGAGKSDVVLRLIDAGAVLVSDDQTELKAEGGKLFASPPASIKGMIEVRHVGLLKMPFLERAEIALYIELVTGEKLERLPAPEMIDLLGVNIRKLKLPAFEASTPAKIRAALLYPTA